MPSSAEGHTHLAFDFGAESGRAVLGRLRNGVISIEEVCRFANEPVAYGGSLHWDVARLWHEVRKALAQLESVEITSIGVDTWGVDYALLGDRGELLQNPYHYRDTRTVGIMEEVLQKIAKEEIYRETGIQFMPINTLYQLYAAARQTAGILEAAKTLLTIPDLFHYWLTGKAVCEFTNATTTQMVNPVKRAWATDLLARLGLPADLPAPLVESGSEIGPLLPDVAGKSEASRTKVIAPASHDTGSAVAAIAARDGTAFLSSGTWSLVGIELDAPVITPEALRMNFTNEGGVGGTTRLLKNVMGLWILQSCIRHWKAHGKPCDYESLMEMAATEPAFAHLVDPDDGSFLRAADMPAAIDEFCRRTHQPAPARPGAYVRAILESLALKYRLVLRNLEQVAGQRIHQIRIIGGGCKNKLLNQFTADASGRAVLAGPVEATAIGNIAVQILATGGAASLREVRTMVDRSFKAESFAPRDTEKWDRQFERFEHYCGTIYA
jgi:rhamnulokinase